MNIKDVFSSTKSLVEVLLHHANFDKDFAYYLRESADHMANLYERACEMQAENERLKNTLRQEAAYCQQHADKYRNTDTDRSARHQLRADRLLAALQPSIELQNAEQLVGGE